MFFGKNKNSNLKGYFRYFWKIWNFQSSAALKILKKFRKNNQIFGL